MNFNLLNVLSLLLTCSIICFFLGIISPGLFKLKDRDTVKKVFGVIMFVIVVCLVLFT